MLFILLRVELEIAVEMTAFANLLIFLDRIRCVNMLICKWPCSCNKYHFTSLDKFMVNGYFKIRSDLLQCPFLNSNLCIY